MKRRVPTLLGRGPAFAVPAVATALGALATVTVGGASVAISVIDLACLAVLAWGASVELQRRKDPVAAAQGGAPSIGWWPARREPALWAYLAFLVVVALQFVLPSIGGRFDVEILTGASRFVGPAALLLGLTWLRPDEVEVGEGGRGPWDWRVGFVALGLVLSAGIAWDVVGALRDGDLGGFYDWKRSLQQPVGVSNIIAGYTAVTFWPALSLMRRDRRWGIAATVLLLATLITLSRGALLGLVVAAAVVVAGRWVPRRVVAGGVLALTLAITVGTIAADTQPGAEDAIASALRVRDEQYTAAFEAWQDRPFLGVGLNRFEEEVTVVTSQPSAAAVDGVIPYEHPNNAWLVALAEVGLLGTLAYLALWLLLIRRIVVHPSPSQRIALAGAATGLAVHAQLEALTFTRGIEVVLALLLAAAWTPRQPDIAG